MKKRKAAKTDGPDIKDPGFWDGMGMELLEVNDGGGIKVKEQVTGSEMAFSTKWTPLRIAKVVANARAQHLK